MDVVKVIALTADIPNDGVQFSPTVPADIRNRVVDALRALDGDSGARSILEQNAEQLVSIATDDAGVLVDIDTVMDLE